MREKRSSKLLVFWLASRRCRKESALRVWNIQIHRPRITIHYRNLCTTRIYSVGVFFVLLFSFFSHFLVQVIFLVIGSCLYACAHYNGSTLM
jgi:hypothetical protein